MSNDLDQLAAEFGDDPEAEVVPKEPKTARKARKPKGTVVIRVEENELIPPTGLPIGHNGVAYLIEPGRNVTVPLGVLEVLDHAIESVPVMDPQTREVIGYREKRRYPYTHVS